MAVSRRRLMGRELPRIVATTVSCFEATNRSAGSLLARWRSRASFSGGHIAFGGRNADGISAASIEVSMPERGGMSVGGGVGVAFKNILSAKRHHAGFDAVLTGRMRPP